MGSKKEVLVNFSWGSWKSPGFLSVKEWEPCIYLISMLLLIVDKNVWVDWQWIGYICEGNRKALVEKSGLVKHAASSSKMKDAQSRQALSAEQQQRNTAHRSVIAFSLYVTIY